MPLKTDYKDDMYTGQRRYKIIENDDGTVTLNDETFYTSEGDSFGAEDINGTNTAVNKNATDIASINAKAVMTQATLTAIEGRNPQKLTTLYATTTVTLPAATSSTQPSKTKVKVYTGRQQSIVGLSATLNNYPLPYVSNGQIKTYIEGAVDYSTPYYATLTIVNYAVAWDSYTLRVVMHFA